MSKETSMGDLFRQRRAKASGPVNAVFEAQQQGKKTFAEIQAEQERETNARPLQSGRRSPIPRGGSGGGNRFGRSRRQQNQHHQQVLSYPIEQGRVCNLKDNFGFIYCADRVEEVFFHYSEVNGVSPHELEMNVEVEFRIGPSAKDPNKLAAFHVKTIPAGTIQWQVPQFDGKRVKGLVERRAMGGRGGRSTIGSSSGGGEGTIRLINEVETNVDDQGNTKASADGPLIRWQSSEYKEEQRKDRRGGGNNVGLGRGDLVECKVFYEKRTGYMYGRDIRLLLSEKERARQEQERRMLESATIEHGVVTSLKGEYGFLRSNSRREEIFFHYSNIHLDDDADSNDGDSEMVLQEGQDMKFLVVNENLGEETSGRQPRRISARRIQMQPRGSVVFHETVCRGVTGTITQVPQCVDSSHALDQHGKIVLDTPIVAKKYSSGQLEEGESEVKEIFLSPQDSPGGKFSFHGGTAVGLWVQVGDKLLFDVVQDYADGACRAAPTMHVTPDAKPGTENDSDEDDDDVVPAVRLIELTLAGRAEGTIGALKEGYGFVQFADRPVDVHFKLFQQLPDELQDDLRRNMGISNTDKKGQPLRLEIGAQVQFDLSIHGTIHGARNRRQKGAQDRENLKAQRILLLPPGSIVMSSSIATAVRARVSKQEVMHPYVGNVELDEPIKPMSLELRNPMVAKMIAGYKNRLKSKPPGEDILPLVFHDIMSSQDEAVVMEMVEAMGNGELSLSRVPGSDGGDDRGRLCISKETVDATNADQDRSDAEASTPTPEVKKKPHKPKLVKSVRFDLQSLSRELKGDAPPCVDDIVECDIIQFRRNNQAYVQSMKLVERRDMTLSVSESFTTGTIKDINSSMKYGFISYQDQDTVSGKETISFSLKPSESPEEEQKLSKLRKGDNVKFNIGTEKNGRRVATNLSVLVGAVPPSRPDKNTCYGYVMLQPSNTSLKSGIVRKNSPAPSAKGEGGGRWDAVDADRLNSGTESSAAEVGFILLTQDPSGAFGVPSPKPEDEREPGEMSEFKTLRLRYKSSAISYLSKGQNAKQVPRRGDLVSFVKSRNGIDIRDVKVSSADEATLVRGQLSKIQVKSQGSGTATFQFDGDDTKTVDVDLAQFVACDVAELKDGEKVEAILHEDALYGLARVSDLYVNTKLGVGNKERPKLNLKVKTAKGGTIMAQSMMAKGPDGTMGFHEGWTERESRFKTQEACPPATPSEMSSATAETDK